MLSLTSSSCNKKSQKTKDTSTKQLKEERDTPQNQEIHAPKSDDRIEINKKKQEQTEKKLNNNNLPPSEEKSK